jgi:gamma-glutamyltranspeptidase / glutathione hydrolase
MFCLRNFGLLAVLSLLLVVINLPRAQSSPLEFSHRDSNGQDGWHHGLGPGKLGAVASESALCSRHGTDILEMGGNAADAVRSPRIQKSERRY